MIAKFTSIVGIGARGEDSALQRNRSPDFSPWLVGSVRVADEVVADDFRHPQVAVLVDTGDRRLVPDRFGVLGDDAVDDDLCRPHAEQPLTRVDRYRTCGEGTRRSIGRLVVEPEGGFIEVHETNPIKWSWHLVDAEGRVVKTHPDLVALVAGLVQTVVAVLAVVTRHAVPVPAEVRASHAARTPLAASPVPLVHAPQRGVA